MLLVTLLLAVMLKISFSQVKIPFSGDISKFREELTVFLGPNLNQEQTAAVKLFIARWDSSGFSRENMARIAEISVKLASRNFRISPHFIDYLKTLTDFSTISKNQDFQNFWLKGLSKMVLKQTTNNDYFDRYFRNTSSMMKDNIIYELGNTKWKVKGNNITFMYDSVFKMVVNDITLTAYSVKDSTEIYKVSGVYFPETAEFSGSKGIITWEKAGYNRDDVFAEIINYRINTTKSNFTIDSARLTHKVYFKQGEYGQLTDQATSYSTPERAIYPKFESYKKEFRINNLYDGVNYEGGLTLDGASVKGTGRNYFPAKITLYRNDTLYLRVRSKSFLLTKNGINSQEASASFYLDKDSIFHSSLGFSFITASRQVTLFRTNNPTSKSPYYDSFHGLDMYFENISWNLNESRVILSRARGASIGQARFESVSFYNSNTFDKLMGIDDEHPLYRLKDFSAYYYGETFPVTEFAKWIKRPEEAVTGLCIDLANKGFLFYDRATNEVTIKKKVDDYIASYGRKKDYDVMSIYSETNSPMDNASLDLKNFRLTVNGVPGVFLSDSQKVAIYPYKNQLVIGKNRSLSFDGVVEAGLFTIFGHNFTFSYDTFKIRLQRIDSIMIAVETDKRDAFGKPVIAEIENLIQLTTAELYIDDPKNKSGLRSLKQYPIIKAITYSYIFYDRLPGLEGVYKQSDYYFKIDPFTYENIDHYKNEDMNLKGEFYAGNILKPTRQYLTIQEDNSLGFRMNIPPEGIDIYSGKGKIFDAISLSNKGLVGSGTLKRLSSSTKSEEYRFFPDSMISKASTFDIAKDDKGKFPVLHSSDVFIKWFPEKDEWLARNTKGKIFEMFGNGTVLDGSLTLTPAKLKGAGIIDMSNSRITSENFAFASSVIQADTSNYNLKSLQSEGYAFIAENVNTTIDFNLQKSKFSLNTGSSVVKFPEIQYICTMTDFSYDMKSRILDMEQRGKAATVLMTPDQLLKLDMKNPDKPTFFATNFLKDTISFSSWKGSYHLQEEYVEAENINYIKIADALIQPENGKVIINKRAKIKPLQNAFLAINNKHILHTANIAIEDKNHYSGSAVYDYVNENKEIQTIAFPVITVDTSTTGAKGFISEAQKFMLSPAFSFTGDVTLSARADLLSFSGAAGIIHNCSTIKSYTVKFKGQIDPKTVMIPVNDKPRDINDNLVFSGSFLNLDSTHIYGAFLSEKKSWTDIQLVNAQGILYFEKGTGVYKIASPEKLADQTLAGDQISFDKNFCIIAGEGKMNFGANFDLLKMNSAGKAIHNLDSGKVNIETIIALDFHFSPDALKLMSDELRMLPTLTPVNLNSDFYKKGMKDLMGEAAAANINEEIGLFGTSKNLPKEFTYELLLNNVNLYWNEPTASFRSKGKIGIGFVGTQALNVYVNGFVEIQRRRSGDMIDIYLKADDATWYYFSYFRGVMMTQAGNSTYNIMIANEKLNDRKHPQSSVRTPYTYMISVEDRLGKFLLRMASDKIEDEPNR